MIFIAFILYRQHYQAQVVTQHPGLANPEISKIIGEQWREQAPEVKSEWKRLADVQISTLVMNKIYVADSKLLNRKRSNAINESIQAIDINLDEQAKQTAYDRSPLCLQTVQYTVKSATDDISRRQARRQRHLHQLLEQVLENFVLYRFLYHEPRRLIYQCIQVQCNIRGWILRACRRTRRHIDGRNIHNRSLSKLTMKETKTWRF